MKNNKSINISYMYQQKKNPERDSFFVDIKSGIDIILVRFLLSMSTKVLYSFFNFYIHINRIKEGFS